MLAAFNVAFALWTLRNAYYMMVTLLALVMLPSHWLHEAILEICAGIVRFQADMEFNLPADSPDVPQLEAV